MHARVQPWVGCALLLVWPLAAAAQDGVTRFSHYQALGLGLRTAAMGGAGVAFGKDSAMPWLNPAGLARLEVDGITLSANAFVSETRHNEDLTTVGIGTQWNAAGAAGSSSGIYPSSLSYALQLDDLGHHVLALSWLVPQQRQRDLRSEVEVDDSQQIGRLLYAETFALKHYEAGPSYALLIEPVTLGVSVLLRYVAVDMLRHRESIGFDRVGAFSFSPVRSASKGFSLDLDFVAGAQVGPLWGGFYAGLAVHAPAINLYGRFDRTMDWHTGRTAGNDVTLTRAVIAEENFELRSPLWFTFGLGYQRPDSFAVALDVSTYLPVGAYTNVAGAEEVLTLSTEPDQPLLLEGKDIELRGKQRGVVNFNLGAEIALLDRLALRLGAFSDFSAAPYPGRYAEAGRSASDRFGGSLGLAYTGQRSQFQAALIYARGSGEVAGAGLEVAPDTSHSISSIERDLTSDTFLFVFSGRIDTASVFAAAQAAVGEEFDRAESEAGAAKASEEQAP